MLGGYLFLLHLYCQHPFHGGHMCDCIGSQRFNLGSIWMGIDGSQHWIIYRDIWDEGKWAAGKAIEACKKMVAGGKKLLKKAMAAKWRNMVARWKGASNQ
jgi:hypothetical protein